LKELKDEVSSERVFNASLDAFCTNDVIYKMAVAGEGMVKIYNLSTWKEIRSERIDLPKDAGRVS
jgi:WD repeat-containing protein 19